MQQNILAYRAEKVAAKWGLTLGQNLQLKRRRALYKVHSPKGPAALKLYQKIGSSGESGAISFLRGLPEGIGVRLYRVSPLRRAVLMEWLEGTSLDQFVQRGNVAEAEQHLAAVAARLTPVRFRFLSGYRRLYNRRMFKRYADAACFAHVAQRPIFQRGFNLLDGLYSSTQTETVIHGDFLFRNTMLTSDGPRVFDPKGFRADPAAEFRLVVTPNHRTMPVSDFTATVTRRAALFADASGLDPLRITQWATVALIGRVMHGSLRNTNYDEVAPYLDAMLALAEV